MLYQLNHGNVGFLTYEELVDDYECYGIPPQTLLECGGNPYNFRSNIYVYDNLVFTLLDLLDFQNVFEEKARLAIYLNRDLCIFVAVLDQTGQVRRLFEKTLLWYEEGREGAKSVTPEKFLYQYLDNLLFDDRTFLENMEFHINALEAKVLKEDVDVSFINDILSLKKELIFIWNYYEQLLDIGEFLRDNESELFCLEQVKIYSHFTGKVKRLSDNVKQLKECIVQLQETYDAMLDYHLNQNMRLFTVIATIFLPLSLIVGWYGMNFDYMPELHWRFGYLVMILGSLLIVLLSLFYFKKKKLI